MLNKILLVEISGSDFSLCLSCNYRSNDYFVKFFVVVIAWYKNVWTSSGSVFLQYYILQSQFKMLVENTTFFWQTTIAKTILYCPAAYTSHRLSEPNCQQDIYD